MSTEIHIDASDLTRAAGVVGREAGQINRALDRLVTRRVAIATRALRQATPRSDADDHPHAADAWEGVIYGPRAGAVENPVAYVPYLFTGTQAHTIRPLEAGTLHFFAGGDEVFTKEVSHPGTSPVDEVVRARDEQVAAAEADLAAYGEMFAVELSHRFED